MLALVAGVVSSSRAQTTAPPIGLPGVGYKVGSITIKFVGTANVNEQVVRANMQLHEGGDLDDSMLDRDIRNLYKTGLFEFIQTKWEVAGEHTYNLVVEVTPKFRVLNVVYLGIHKVKSKRLDKEVKTKPNTALDERQVKEDSEKIREYYQKEGYNQVSVTYVVDRDRSTGFGTVIFRIREGNQVRILEHPLRRQRPHPGQAPAQGDGDAAVVDLLLADRHRAITRTTPSTTIWASCGTTIATTASSTSKSRRRRSPSTTRSGIAWSSISRSTRAGSTTSATSLSTATRSIPPPSSAGWSG